MAGCDLPEIEHDFFLRSSMNHPSKTPFPSKISFWGLGWTRVWVTPVKLLCAKYFPGFPKKLAEEGRLGDGWGRHGFPRERRAARVGRRATPRTPQASTAVRVCASMTETRARTAATVFHPGAAGPGLLDLIPLAAARSPWVGDLCEAVGR